MNAVTKQVVPKKRKSLPLIDFRLTPSAKLIRGAEFHARMMWMINLRWLAVFGLAFGLPVGQMLLGIRLLIPPLIVLAAILGLHNLVSHLVTRRIRASNNRGLFVSANVQISVDILLLTLLIHFSGGFENPFIISYVYHMIIAAILLTARAAYLQAAWASVLIGAQTVLTQAGHLPQPRLDDFLRFTLNHEAGYIWTFYVILVCTLFLVVYMTYSISKELKAREERLEETNELLREKDRLKSEYVLALSHDLQQPLAAVQANLKVVLDGYVGGITEKAHDMIETAERRLSQSLRIIRDLLSLSRITSKRDIDKHSVNLVELLGEIEARAEGLAHDRNQVFELVVPNREVSVSANYEMLRQAVWNLVDNAIKYTPDGGKVSLQLSGGKDRIVVSVEDTGIGIPEEETGAVFADFYRSKNAVDWDKDGTGLGLAIVKHAVEAHGGSIEIVSPRPEFGDGDTPGTRIRVCLPASAV